LILLYLIHRHHHPQRQMLKKEKSFVNKNMSKQRKCRKTLIMSTKPALNVTDGGEAVQNRTIFGAPLLLKR
jgi:hypothetical protein